MKQPTRFTIPGRTTIALAAAVVLGTALPAWSADDPAARKQAKSSAQATYQNARKACDSMSGNAKDICVVEAKATRDKAIAQADATQKGTPKAHLNARMAAAKADYNVAVERCDDKAGNDKDVCVKEAKAARTRVEADAKASRESTETRKDARQAKQDADYKVAAEKCDSMSGDSKDACIARAKATHRR